VNKIIHQPVLVEEVLEFLKVASGKNYIDCTLGEGGHAEAILFRTGPSGKLLGIEKDAAAFKKANQRLKRFNKQTVLVRQDYTRVQSIYDKQFPYPVDGVLFDLGISSLQLEDSSRGFSFVGSRPLDMRFDSSGEDKTAAEILNTYLKKDLEKIFRNFAQVERADELAEKIQRFRRRKKFKQTEDLVSLTNKLFSVPHARVPRRRSAPTHSRRARGAVRGRALHDDFNRGVFQALRMEVNQEPARIKASLPQTLEILGPGGRLAVISFHSVEDRIVKNFINSNSKHFKVITKKPIVAGRQEQRANRRSRSAKLRVAQKR
jgi:16S rRNA (cytosine1402-N4)-methyltransferase